MRLLSIDLNQEQWLLLGSDFQLIGLEEVLSNTHLFTLVICEEESERVLLKNDVHDNVSLLVSPSSKN